MLCPIRYLKKTISKQFSRIVLQAHFYGAKAKPKAEASKLLRIDEGHGVREIVLNNPKTKNSLSKEMLVALKEAIEHKQNDISLRAIVLSAKGNVWSAGHNLKEIGAAIHKAKEAAKAKECEEKLKKECEEAARAKECEEQEKLKESEETAKARESEGKLTKECEEAARAKECEEKLKKECEEAARAKECEEQEKLKESEETAKARESEGKLTKECEEAARAKECEEKLKKECEEAARAKECEEQEKLKESEETAMARESEEKLAKECEEAARAKECEEKLKKECEEAARAKECEEKLKKECEEKAKNRPPANVFEQLSQLIQTIMKCPVPVIAKIDGYTAAAGLQLAVSCDVTICTKGSQFATSAVLVGLFGSTPAVAISRLIPRSKALHMLFTGLPISADEAYLNGLVSKVVPNGMVDEAVEDFTMDLKKVSRAVIEHGKLTFYKSLDLPLDKAYAAACEAMMKNLEIPDAEEGVKSFLEKRKPKWTHKMRA